MKTIRLICGALAALAMAACSSSGTESQFDRIDYIPVRESENGNWSFYSPDGSIKYPDEFKNTPSTVINGYFTVKESKGTTLYKAGDKPTIVKGAEGLYSAGVMMDGVIPVTFPKERISLLNGKGEKVATLEPVKGKEIIACETCVHDGMIWIGTEDDLYGFADAKGAVKIAPKYNNVWSFSEGLALVSITDDKSDNITYSVIDKKGNQVFKISEGFTPVTYSFAYGYLLMEDRNDHIVFLDKKGEKAYTCPAKVTGVDDYNSKYFVFKNDEHEYGVMDYEFNVVIRPKYDNIRIVDTDKFLASDDDTSLLLDKDGATIQKFEDFKGILWAGKWNYIAQDKRTYCFLDKEGKPVKNAEFEDISIWNYNYRVSSDYFNLSAVVNDVFDMVTAKGVGKYDLNEKPSAHFTDPEKYTYQSEVKLNDLTKSGYRYKITVTANFTANMGDWDYNGWNRYYYWNQNAKLNSFEINIDAESNWDNKCSEAMVDRFTKAGYKVIADSDTSDEYIALLRKDNMMLIIGNGNHKDGGVIVFEYSKQTEDALKSSIQSLNKGNNNATVDINDLAVEEADWEALCDSVAVEEALVEAE
ncbi:MAG: WG repeat-containing protein [Muribaculaceae bacterium]|nr:WG repeat-containing protein [Muribaculaceae bacterium]